MRKLKLIFKTLSTVLLAAFLTMNVAFGQLTCSTAINVAVNSTTTLQVTDSVIWLKFIADNTGCNIGITPPANPAYSPAANITAARLYSGSCANLTMVDIDSNLFIDYFSMIIGNAYYIKLSNPTRVSGYFDIHLNDVKEVPVSDIGPCNVDMCYNLVCNSEFRTAVDGTPPDAQQKGDVCYYTDYLYEMNLTSISKPGQEHILAIAHDWNPQWVTDGGTPDGSNTNFLAADGSLYDTTKNIWRQKIAVAKSNNNLIYHFSFWVKNLNCTHDGVNPAARPIMKVRINGQVVNFINTTPVTNNEPIIYTGNWVRLCADWPAPVGTGTDTADITIRTTNINQYWGNDVGIDHIEFGSCIPPAEVTISNAHCYVCDGNITIGTFDPEFIWPWQYQWSNGATTNSINSLCRGEYTVTVTDAINQKYISTFTVYSIQADYNTKPNKTTYLSEYPFFNGVNNTGITGKTLGIEGNLVIDKDYTFTNCSLLMAKDVRIDVASGKTVTFTNCTLQEGCDYMWDGLYVTSSTGKIVMNSNCNVYDANYAVRSENGGKLTIQHTLFDRNYCAIYIKTKQTGASSDIVLEDNIINSGNLLPDMGGTSMYGMYLTGCTLTSSPYILSTRNNIIGYFARSIYISNSNASIERNQIVNAGGFGVYIINSPDEVVINNSRINTTSFAVYGLNNIKKVSMNADTINNFVSDGVNIITSFTQGPTFTIRNCVIDQAPKNGGTGIYLRPNLTSGTATVEDNKIGKSSSKMLTYGINLQNFSTAQVHGNDVYIKNAVNPSVGINVSGCSNSNIHYNYIWSTTISGTNQKTYGIKSNNNISAVTCNTSHNVGAGTWFGGNNAATLIHANTLDYCYDGIYIYDCTIGTQGVCNSDPSDNQWTGTIANSQIMTDNWNAINNTFNYRNTGTYAINYLLVKNKNSAQLANIYPCPNPASPHVCGTRGGSSDRPDKIKMVLANIKKYKTDAVEKAWMDYYDVYSQLKKNKNWTDNDNDLKNVEDSLEKTSVGDIYKIYQLLNDNSKPADIKKLLKLNSSIVPTTVVEESFKKVHEIFLNNFAQENFELDKSQISTLVEIAKKCPFKYGDAVFEARGMLAMTGDKTEYINSCETSYNDDNTRNSGNSETLVSPVNDNEIARDIKIYPNPANNSITVEYSFNNTQKGQIEVYNLTGRKIVSQLLNGNENRVILNTNNWESGIYTYKIIVDNNIVMINKLTILK
jgi:hypothetical protein